MHVMLVGTCGNDPHWLSDIVVRNKVVGISLYLVQNQNLVILAWNSEAI